MNSGIEKTSVLFPCITVCNVCKRTNRAEASKDGAEVHPCHFPFPAWHGEAEGPSFPQDTRKSDEAHMTYAESHTRRGAAVFPLAQRLNSSRRFAPKVSSQLLLPSSESLQSLRNSQRSRWSELPKNLRR
jgi:hypothetical protein